MGKAKIKAASEEKTAARKLAAAMRQVVEVSRTLELPDARHRSSFKVVPSNIDDGPRTNKNKSTVRRLTKAEMLRRSDAIDDDQASGIDRYVRAADSAYGDCVRATTWGDGGGSSPTIAASARHDTLLDRLDRTSAYWRARRAIPDHLVAPFERVVLDNHHLGDVGESLRPGASGERRSAAVRELVRTCADAICFEFGIKRKDMREHLQQTMNRFDQHVRTVAANTPMADALTAALAAARPSDELLVSPDVMADVMRETGSAERLTTWGEHAIVVVEHWSFGWLVQVSPMEEQRAA